MKKLVLLLLVVTLSTMEMYAQINIKIGGAVAYIDNKVNQSILNRFDAGNPDMIDGYGALDYVFGLQTGLRYTTGPISWDLTYQKLGNKLQAAGHAGTSEFVEKNLFYDFQHIDLGFEHTIQKVGYGASIGYSFLNVKINSNTTKQKVKIMNDYMLNSQFFLSFHVVKTELMELVIRPYMEIGWDDYYMKKLDQYINPSSTAIGKNLVDNVKMFGLSFVVYNGPQQF